jgi:hypothetical protein
MNGRIALLICAVLGLVMLICGLSVPAHLRAVDASVVLQAGRNTPALPQKGLTLAREDNFGAAQLVLRAAKEHGLPDWENLDLRLNDLASQHLRWPVWGGGSPHLEELFKNAQPPELPTANGPNVAPEPVTDWAIRYQNRATVLELLRVSPRPVVQELLRFRAVTNTVLFPPSQSASGQALDAALAITGLLCDEDQITSSLSNAVFLAVSAANRGATTEPLEQMLMDFLSLGQRLNWSQLAAFVNRIPNAETLRLHTGIIRRAESDLPVLFSAVQLSGNPAAVANYVVNHGQTGFRDLGWSLRAGEGGIDELLHTGEPLYISSVRPRLAAYAPVRAGMDILSEFTWRLPALALAFKWVFYLLSGFLLAAALHYARPEVPPLERPLQVRGFHIAREALFALGFLFVVLLLSEPFLAQENQKVDLPFRLRLPTVGRAVPTSSPVASKFTMTQSDLWPLLLFFILQGLLYVACLVKLAEIRRQRVPARIKLKLLENEDHLFDAGLYLGFLGTIVSFILYSVGVMKQFSLMVAYSSTSFGIVFVSLFKILNLRPARRKLVLDAEAAASEPSAERHGTYVTTS